MVQALMPQVGTKRKEGHSGGVPQKYFLDDQQRLLLLERYDGRTETIDDLMKYFPGVPRTKVRAWAGQLGLARQKEPQWTPEEEEYLQHNLHRMSLRDIARKLGRTKVAVRLRAKRIGANKTQEGYTMRGLCMGLGCDHHKVQRWLSRGWLKGYRRKTERELDIWYFSDGAIRDFVKKHPEEIDPRRADWLWLVDVLLGGIGSLGSEASA